MSLPSSINTCLIFSNYPLNPRDGGPSGFLAQNLLGSTSTLYYLMGPDLPQPSGSMIANLKRKIIRKSTIYKPKTRLPISPGFKGWLDHSRYRFIVEHAANYRMIWFHDVWSLYACADLIGDNQLVVLQPHTPELPSSEVQANLQPEGDIEWSKSAEKSAFARANIIVLPNKQVIPIFESLLCKENQIRFLTSGAKVDVPRFKVPLDPDFIYYLFVGRRNEIKGFETLIRAFKRAYATNPKLRLLLLGRGNVRETPGVIDLGFMENPISWMTSADYVVSTNQQSYFDLTAMETLGTGTPFIYFPTGGHAALDCHNSTGLVSVIDSNEDGLTHCLLSNTQKRSANSIACSENRNVFLEYYSDYKYRERLELMIGEILHSN
ncbi:MAG: glycosyltransferase [Luteolibacter sp.]